MEPGRHGAVDTPVKEYYEERQRQGLLGITQAKNSSSVQSLSFRSINP
jgi:hypothetical protein